jgi:hypothetical protein
MSVADAFSQLLGRQATEQERERLHRVKAALKLSDNDALWSILVALEFYDSLYREYPRKIAEELRSVLGSAVSDARKAPRKTRTDAFAAESAWPSMTSLRASTRWLPALLAYQVMFGAVCITVGVEIATGDTPLSVEHYTGWGGAARVVLQLLRAPAGWMIYVLLLPVVLAGIRIGYALTSVGSRGTGWSVICVCAACALACAVVLLRLL